MGRFAVLGDQCRWWGGEGVFPTVCAALPHRERGRQERKRQEGGTLLGPPQNGMGY